MLARALVLNKGTKPEGKPLDPLQRRCWQAGTTTKDFIELHTFTGHFQILLQHGNMCDEAVHSFSQEQGECV